MFSTANGRLRYRSSPPSGGNAADPDESSGDGRCFAAKILTGGLSMGSNFSIAQVLAELESEIAEHREREAYHAEQEVFHREQRAFRATELKIATERFEAFRLAAAAAGERVERRRAATAVQQAPAAEPEDVPFPAGTRRPIGLLVLRVVASLGPEEVFGPTAIAQEVNRRYGRRLRYPVDGRAASVNLRRLAATREIQLVRQGTAHREALYSKTRPKR
jgi:hypothetical protein